MTAYLAPSANTGHTTMLAPSSITANNNNQAHQHQSTTTVQLQTPIVAAQANQPQVLLL